MRYKTWIAIWAVVALLGMGRPAWAVLIAQSDGSQFDVTLIAHGGGVYTYEVTEIAGKDLSHWVLVLGACMDHLVSASPAAGLELGHDASTGAAGVKWNAPYSGASPWQFVITLDQEYPIGEITAVVKAGSTHASGTVDGPICDVLPPPDDPQQDPTETPTATATEQGGTIPPATATNTPGNNGTIPPATETASPTPTAGNGETLPSPTATQQGGTIPPAPTATATDQGGTIPPAPTATATNAPGQPTATNTAVPVTVTIEPPTATPTAPGSTPQAPTATPTAHPESEPVQWLPIVQNCGFGDNGFMECGR